MPCSNCPNCNKLIDIDGYVEHGVPALFYCECGKIYDMPRFMKLEEIPKEEVDLSGLKDKYPAYLPTMHERVSRGLFIRKERWKKKEG